MNRKSIANKLELAYSPLTSYEFAIVKDDKYIEQALERACLYVIGQRPVITFENLVHNFLDNSISFEIHQKGNKNILKRKIAFKTKLY